MYAVLQGRNISVQETILMYGKQWTIIPTKSFQGTEIYFVRYIDSLPKPTINLSNKRSV